ncbi:glycosyltransferase family A protein [Gordonia sp. PKS22-38]|uniref:Glycosyltransferase family A protein n=1 Tax=Gordonia prachuapensis TaxID=3115651 RepID=A0ABU7MRQ8_9ACTN|nr:glycosyltransferase family A protein [Gordonia sp. PKS22-38]
MPSRRNPQVTVLMPVYNAAGYVADAARSILAEPVDDLELLVVDDGSTDESVAELTSLQDERIRVVSQPNSGLVAALNTGLGEARGTYLARMDADDLSVPGRIAAQVRWLEDRPGAVACGTDYEMFGAVTGRVRLPRTDRGCRERLLLGSCHCGASVVLRRTVVETARLRFDPDFPHAEDYEFFTRLAAYGELGNVPMVGYRYRMHDDQVSSRHVDVQRSVHLRVAARYAARIGMPPLSDDVVRKIMWPETDGVARATLVTAGAAAQALRRRPGIQTARFTGRRVVEAALSAAKS